MSDADGLVQWQLWDYQVGACFPWFVHSCLEEIREWQMWSKRVLEYGGGRSTRWWRKKTDWVTTIDTNAGWAAQIISDCEQGRVTGNGQVICLDGFAEADESKMQEYVNAGDCFAPYDIVVIDGIHRHQCLVKALTLPRPLTIIHDNWKQDGFICPESEELMKDFEGTVYVQEDHTDNHGNKWSTAIWHLK